MSSHPLEVPILKHHIISAFHIFFRLTGTTSTPVVEPLRVNTLTGPLHGHMVQITRVVEQVAQ